MAPVIEHQNDPLRGAQRIRLHVEVRSRAAGCENDTCDLLPDEVEASCSPRRLPCTRSTDVGLSRRSRPTPSGTRTCTTVAGRMLRIEHFGTRPPRPGRQPTAPSRAADLAKARRSPPEPQGNRSSATPRRYRSLARPATSPPSRSAPVRASHSPSRRCPPPKSLPSSSRASSDESTPSVTPELAQTGLPVARVELGGSWLLFGDRLAGPA